MKNLIYFELNNILKRREFKFVIFILLIASIVDFWIICAVYEGYPTTLIRAYFDEFILVTPYSSIGRQLYTGFLFSIVISIVYSDSLIVEKCNNIDNYIYTRTSKKKHIIAKAIAIFSTMFILTMSALLLNYVLVKFTFPEIGHSSLMSVPQSVLGSEELFKSYLGYDLTFLQKMYFENKDLYLISLILFKSLVAGCISIFTLAISTIINKFRIIAILISSIFINVIPIFEEFIGTRYMLSFINFHIVRELSSYMIVFIIINIISIVLIKNWIYNDDI